MRSFRSRSVTPDRLARAAFALERGKCPEVSSQAASSPATVTRPASACACWPWGVVAVTDSWSSYLTRGPARAKSSGRRSTERSSHARREKICSVASDDSHPAIGAPRLVRLVGHAGAVAWVVETLRAHGILATAEQGADPTTGGGHGPIVWVARPAEVLSPGPTAAERAVWSIPSLLVVPPGG